MRRLNVEMRSRLQKALVNGRGYRRGVAMASRSLEEGNFRGQVNAPSFGEGRHFRFAIRCSLFATS